MPNELNGKTILNMHFLFMQSYVIINMFLVDQIKVNRKIKVLTEDPLTFFSQKLVP